MVVGSAVTPRREGHEGSVEDLFWERLRAAPALHGFRFRRRQTIGGFVVDFYCPELELVVEIDEELDPPAAARHRALDEVLSALGLRVLHVPAAVVRRDPASVVARLGEHVRATSRLPVVAP